MTATRQPPRLRQRHLGVLGTVARVAGGSWLLFHAVQHGIGATDVLFGLVVPNAVVMAMLAARGLNAPPLRMIGPVSHVVNMVGAVAAFELFHQPALLFAGSASLLAAARGYGGCEMFAVSNWLRRRDDQFGCPFYLPCDAVDQLLSGRPRQC